MQREQMKTALVGAWVLATGVIALSLNVSTVNSWFLVLGLGVLPPLVLLRMWREPVPTMSQSIREVLK